MLLQPGMFGHEFDHKGAKANIQKFGLATGQMRGYGGHQKCGHNMGWYNSLGQKIGWGDLSVEDLIRMRGILLEEDSDETFITMHESDSFWEFVKWQSKNAQVDRQGEAQPGMIYLIEHAVQVVTKDGIYLIMDRYDAERYKEGSMDDRGFIRKTREWLRDRLPTP